MVVGESIGLLECSRSNSVRNENKSEKGVDYSAAGRDDIGYYYSGNLGSARHMARDWADLHIGGEVSE